MSERDVVLEVLRGIYRDFTDRRGLEQEWNMIDDDIKEEILFKWYGIINSAIRPFELWEPPQSLLVAVRG